MAHFIFCYAFAQQNQAEARFGRTSLRPRRKKRVRGEENGCAARAFVI